MKKTHVSEGENACKGCIYLQTVDTAKSRELYIPMAFYIREHCSCRAIRVYLTGAACLRTKSWNFSALLPQVTGRVAFRRINSQLTNSRRRSVTPTATVSPRKYYSADSPPRASFFPRSSSIPRGCFRATSRTARPQIACYIPLTFSTENVAGNSWTANEFELSADGRKSLFLVLLYVSFLGIHA